MNAEERVILRRELRRARMVAFFTKLTPTEVVMEACGGSYHWGRVLTALTMALSIAPENFASGRHLAVISRPGSV